jgi:DNA-directed RNA polymerase alpha subunit
MEINPNENILNKDINDFVLSIRSVQALEKLGINTFSQILSKDEAFFSPANRFDMKSREEILKLVKDNGFDFKKD